MTEKNKENLEQKQDKQSILNKLLNLVSICNLKKVWQKIWGKDLPKDIKEIFPDDKFQENEQINFYNKLKRKLAVKRFFVSLAIIICSYIVLNSLFSSIMFAIKNNPAIACWNKSVCIYAGPKLNNPSDYVATTKLENGDIFIVNNYLFKNQHEVLYKLFCNKNERNQICEFFRQKDNKISEVYNIKNNKFKKIKSLKLHNNRHHLIYTNDLNKVVLYSISKDKPIEIYDSKSRNYIAQESYGNKYIYLFQYKNRPVFITNNSNYNNERLFNDELTDFENLVYFNVETNETEKFPSFSQKIKYIPIKSDIIITSNNKLIIPIRQIKKDNKNKKENWDHIEIFIPSENKFISSFNIYALKDNLFYTELKNGNILFVNKDISYIFNDKTNNFEQVDLYTQNNINNLLEETNKLLYGYLGITLENQELEITKYIKISPDKFLITCGENSYLRKPFSVCKQTIYLDIENLNVTKGPDFVYSYFTSDIQKISNDKYIVIGGANVNIFDSDCKINKYTQIIKIK